MSVPFTYPNAWNHLDAWEPPDLWNGVGELASLVGCLAACLHLGMLLAGRCLRQWRSWRARRSDR